VNISGCLCEYIILDGDKILQWIFKKCYGVMDIVGLSQYRDKCLSVANAVTHFVFHKMCGISWLAEDLLASPRRTLVSHLSVSL